MRRIIALSLLLSSLSAPALAVQDRYGPPRADTAGAEGSAATSARYLNWAGKSAAPDYEAKGLPAPVSPWATRQSGAAPQPATTALPPPPDRPQPIMRPAPAVVATPVQGPAPMAEPVQRTTDLGRMPPPVGAWSERQSSAASAPARDLPPPVRPVAAASGDANAPRFYSVTREFGGQPDRIATPTPRVGEGMILAEVPTGNSVGKPAANNSDIPVSQTKQNAAATRNSSIDF